MYLLAYMLASKAKYFTNVDDYDGYACHLAYATYSRMKDPNKVKIKSVLNYMKSVMYFRKMSYQNESFAEIIDPVYNSTWNGDLYTEKSIAAIEAGRCEELQEGINDIIKSLPWFIKESIPNVYKNDKLTYHNLYLSSMLSVLSRFTLPKNYEEYLAKKRASSSSFDEVNYYRKHLDDNAIILWKLPDSMAPVIELILKKVKAQLVQEIKEVSNDYKITDSMFRNMSNNLIFGEGINEDYDL